MYRFCGYQIFAPEGCADFWESAAVKGGRYRNYEDAVEATALVVRSELKALEDSVSRVEREERTEYARLHKKYGKKK